MILRRALELLGAAIALSLAVVTPGPASGAGGAALDDTVAPVLSSLSVEPAAVDTTGGPAGVAVTATITDDLSGFVWGVLWFRSPSGLQAVSALPGDPGNAFTPLGGDRYAATVVFQPWAEHGTWHVDHVALRDLAGNFRSLYRSELQVLGLDVTVTVTGGTPDTAGPVLSAITVDPAEVDVSSATSAAPATLTVTAAVTDDLSGFAGGDLRFRSPSGTRATGGFFWPPSDPPTVTLRLNRYAENGVWRLDMVYLRDLAGNFRSLERDDLDAIGVDASFTVSGGIVDAEAPVLSALSVEPSTVVRPGSVTVRATIADDVSGFVWATVWLRSPSGGQAVTTGDPAMGFRPLGGDRYEATLAFGEHAETGTWRVLWVELVDDAHNFRHLSPSDLEALGLDIAVEVRAPDLTPPALTAGDVAVDATSPSGAVATFLVTATDDTDPQPAVACSPASGSLFPIGDTTVACTATDAAGNSASATFTVHVRGAGEQVEHLIAVLDGYAIAGKHGASLHEKLVAARDLILRGKRWRAGEQLDSFLKEVRNQTGKTVTAEQASELTLRARRVEDVLDVA
jgi:hypothetical protein